MLDEYTQSTVVMVPDAKHTAVTEGLKEAHNIKHFY
jgi:hypothetical protein